MTRTINELTPKERPFCRYRARGSNATQAYRLAWNRPRLNSNSASSRAAEVGGRPRVIAHLDDLFRAAKKSDILSQGQYLNDVRRDWHDALEAGNYTAAASFTRLAGQCIAAVSDTVVVENRLTDEQLLDKLGSHDSVLRERLERLIGAKDTFH